MAKTLINGTAYTIDHGNTRVNGTNYTIDHGITRVNGTNYNIALAAASSGGGNWSWPGWSSATWQDINNLCKAKQNGDIASWPSDVVKNQSEKTLSFSTSPYSYTGFGDTVTVRLRELDELPDTLTFSVLINTSTMAKMPYGATRVWSTSNARSACQQLYNDAIPENKSYIVPVVKRTSTNWDSRYPPAEDITEDTTDYFFLPAQYELIAGFYHNSSMSSSLEGTVYNNTLKQSLYNSGMSRLGVYWQEADLWTRSRANGVTVWTEQGNENVSNYRGYICPFFIIGNPNAS